MNWHERINILRWRSLEEADAGAEWLSVDKRREATARARGGLRASDEEPMQPEATMAFLARRCGWLDREAVGDKSRSALKTMTVPSGRWWWAIAGWVLVFVAGFGLTGIGTEREINLLALPLVGLLLWNAVVMLAGVIFEMMPDKELDDDAGWFASLVMRLTHGATSADRSAHEEIFHEFAWPLAVERMQSRSRAWLHIAAAVLALGSCAGMYVKGWSHEYRAVWESTLLNPNQAQTFFSTLFWPASKALNVGVPVGDISTMQRTGGVVERPADALPWIHLYATTLLLLIVSPRLLLAAWTVGRGHARVGRLWNAFGWDAYSRRLLRSIEGGDEAVQVLTHAMPEDEAHRSRWMCAIREKLGGMSKLDFKVISSGDEDEFATGWVPEAHVVIALFQLATTPEEEVQRKLAADLRCKLHGRFADGKLIALVDALSVQERWTPEHIESRTQLWRKMLADVVDEIHFIGNDPAANQLRVPVSNAR